MTHKIIEMSDGTFRIAVDGKRKDLTQYRTRLEAEEAAASIPTADEMRAHYETLRASGVTVSTVAAHIDVSYKHVWQIVNGWSAAVERRKKFMEMTCAETNLPQTGAPEKKGVLDGLTSQELDEISEEYVFARTQLRQPTEWVKRWLQRAYPQVTDEMFPVVARTAFFRVQAVK